MISRPVKSVSSLMNVSKSSRNILMWEDGGFVDNNNLAMIRLRHNEVSVLKRVEGMFQ